MIFPPYEAYDENVGFFLYIDGPVYTIFNLKEVEQGHLIWLHPRR